MAQEVQIVPKYQHSHVETYINDYSEYTENTVAYAESPNKFLAVFRSGQGIDNVLIKKTDLSDFYKTYGRSNYSKYGQPLMMPIAMLNSGNASVYCMRVMPDDAFAANCILSMLYKMDEITGKFIIKYRASYIDKSAFEDTKFYRTGEEFKKQLKMYAQALKTNEPDADGFYQIPLVTFRMAGRGTYGNDYRFRIARNLDYEKDYGVKMYSFEALQATNGINKVATFVGAMVTSPDYNELTLINDILDDTEVGAAVMDVQVLEDNYEEVYGLFKEFVEGLDVSQQDEIPAIDEWDPFFGLNIANDIQNKNMEIIPETVDSEDISVDRPQGTALSGGDDGAFAATDEQEIYRAEIDAYIKAFSGDFDSAILSVRRTPITALLDANYPFEVKQVLADLANTREDCICYIDGGIDTTLGEVENFIEEYAVFNTRNIVKEFQHYSVRDIETKKKCEVTITYFYAQVLGAHYSSYGSYVPFVKDRAQLSGHVKNSLRPCIDDTANDVKELLYTNRVNYFEAIAEDTYQRASQSTAQTINSDLLEENNMNTLFEIKRIIEKDCWDNLYDFTSSEDRARFTEFENAKFANWSNRQVDTINISFDATEWELQRSIIHCYVAVQFRTLNKRTIIEIDVNKRNLV